MRFKKEQNHAVYYFGPFYQLMRQTLRAGQMIIHNKSEIISADKYLHMKKLIESNPGYNLSQTLDEIRPAYRFTESCQDTVPQAIIAFLESTDFEDAIRKAISLGGDSDTLAAITGSIAEAAYGVPDLIKDKALGYLDEPLRAVYNRWEIYIENG